MKGGTMLNKNQKTTNACGSKSLDAVNVARDAEENLALKENMAGIAHKIVVLSGKGGVGKSTVAVNLAVALAEKKFKTGLLDIDIHGPSVPKLLGMENAKLFGTEDGKLLPVEYNDCLRVMSVAFMLSARDDAVIWRGPLKYGIIKQFLKDVLWGKLDYLIIDSPPGTGDEPLTICQLLDKPDGAVVVTTPQDIALIDVRKSITFCRQLKMPLIGVIENMSGFVCPHCGTRTDIFKTGGGEKMACEMGVNFLGSIPIESHIASGGDMGHPFNNQTENGITNAQSSFKSIVETIINGAK
jgi:ATP-binding protein involved in chromosome partitioning